MRKDQFKFFMKKLFLIILICPFALIAGAQKIYPTHWWVGMKEPKLQLMIHQKDIGKRIPVYKLPAAGSRIADGVVLKAVHHVENPNYVFLDLEIDKNARPGKRTLSFGSGANTVGLDYELKPRNSGNGTSRAKGVNSADFIYLLIPDRFF